MFEKTFSLARLQDTQKLAQTLGSRLRCGDVVTLVGDLGAGKTTFTQFLLAPLCAATVEVTSPTFTLLHTYPATLADGSACEIYHYDLYRVEHPSALAELGFDEAFRNVTIIEWPDRMVSMRVPVTLALSFTLANDGSRSVTLKGDAQRWSDVTL